MSTRRVLPMLVLLAHVGCGDDGGDAPRPDARDVDGGPTGACAELERPAGTIDTYPGSFSDSVVGAGADLSVAEGVCDIEGDPDDPSWYEPVGEDAVVHLTNLTVGAEYGVILDAEDDLGFYVITGCDSETGGPGAGMCPLFDDRGLAGEQNVFTATTTEAWVVVDTANFGDGPATGDFELRVIEPECSDDTDCAGGTPACVEFECVECGTSFDCTAAAEPLCNVDTNTCGAGPSACTGDDAGDMTGGGDDGPAGARVMMTPTTGVETTSTGAICSADENELDWYRIQLTAGAYGFELTSGGGTADLDLYLLDAAGTVIARGDAAGNAPEAFVGEVTATGTYYLVVDMYEPSGQAAAIAYTVRARVAECETSFDCDVAAEPYCSAGGACIAGPLNCTGDDAGDAGGSDDGPAGARSLTPAPTIPDSATGAICNVPGTEVDYYAINVVAGQPLSLDLTWTDNANLDLFVYDEEGTLYGATIWATPEEVDLTYLPAGTYYAAVTLYSTTAVTAAVSYTITATVDVPASCDDAADCAAEYSTQLFRGSCTSGVCEFLPPGNRDAGQACDSNDDCASQQCSYILFEADAQDSFCTVACTDQAACGSLAGARCLVDYGFCVPVCANDLECGANPQSSMLDADQPWDYLTCAVDTGVCSL